MGKIDTRQNQDLIRRRNQKRVLESIMHFGTITIKELSDELNLSVTTIITILDYLLDMGIIIDNGYVSTKRGRRPTSYAINSNFKYIITIDLGRPNAHIGLVNLHGDFLEIRKKILLYDDYNNFIVFLSDFINSILDDNKINVNELAAIVIGNVGVVNEATGSVSCAAGIAVWKSQPLKLMLEDIFPCKVIIKNDINLSTIGENKKGIAQHYNNFIFLRFDVGCKIGIVLNGKLYEGENGAAGEIGFSLINLYSCDMSPEKQVEQNIVISNLIDKIKLELEAAESSSLLEYCSSNNTEINTEYIGKFFFQDYTVNHILNEYIIFLGNLIINIASILDVPLVVLGGELAQLGDNFLDSLVRYVVSNCFFAPEIKFSTISEHGGLIGAYFIGIEDFLNSFN